MKSNYTVKVMLVDDNSTDNFIHERILKATGFSDDIIIKNSGKSGLEYLEKNKDNTAALPDIIFLDINMPIVDGFSFLFEFENFPQLVKDHCKIVILSSSDSLSDINRIL